MAFKLIRFKKSTFLGVIQSEKNISKPFSFAMNSLCLPVHKHKQTDVHSRRDENCGISIFPVFFPFGHIYVSDYYFYINVKYVSNMLLAFLLKNPFSKFKRTNSSDGRQSSGNQNLDRVRQNLQLSQTNLLMKSASV